jgi:hypothetical protein
MPLLTISMSEVPAADAGVASGFSNLVMQVSAAIGLAAMGTISAEEARVLLAQGDPIPVAMTGGFQLAFVLAALCVSAALGVVVTVLRPARPRETMPAAADGSFAEAEAA